MQKRLENRESDRRSALALQAKATPGYLFTDADLKAALETHGWSLEESSCQPVRQPFSTQDVCKLCCAVWNVSDFNLLTDYGGTAASYRIDALTHEARPLLGAGLIRAGLWEHPRADPQRSGQLPEAGLWETTPT